MLEFRSTYYFGTVKIYNFTSQISLLCYCTYSIIFLNNSIKKLDFIIEKNFKY